MANMTGRAAVAVLVMTVGLLGCSDDGQPTNTAAGTAASTTDAADGGEAATGPLLTEDDLPDGWVLSEGVEDDGLGATGTGDPDEPAAPGCEILDELGEADRVRFADGEQHVLVHIVLTTADAAEAETAYDCLEADLGETPDGPVEPQPVDGVGDDAYVASTGPPIPITLGAVRRGTAVSTLMAFGLDGSDDTALVTDLLAVTADRLPA